MIAGCRACGLPETTGESPLEYQVRRCVCGTNENGYLEPLCAACRHVLHEAIPAETWGCIATDESVHHEVREAAAFQFVKMAQT